MAVLTAAVGAWLWFGSAPPVAEARGPSVIVLPFETLSAARTTSSSPPA